MASMVPDKTCKSVEDIHDNPNMDDPIRMNVFFENRSGNYALGRQGNGKWSVGPWVRRSTGNPKVDAQAQNKQSVQVSGTINSKVSLSFENG
jgi:hypothetical protein